LTLLLPSTFRRGATTALMLWSLGLTSACAQNTGPSPSLAELRAGFLEPPAQARLRCYWWWLNGNTDKATITNDLEQMKAKGFGGALLVDANGSNQNGNLGVPAGPTFASPAWVELFKHALAEADRLGLEITFNITSGWNLGGPDVTPAQASKLLTYTRIQVKGGAPVSMVLPAPPAKNNFYRQIAVLAYPLAHGAELAAQPSDAPVDRHPGPGVLNERRSAATLRFRAAAAETGFSMPDSSAMLNPGPQPEYADTSKAQVQEISAHVSADGTLTWSPPAGQWEILRIGYTDSGAVVSTASGKWQGLAIDYLSHRAFDEYWDHTLEPLLAAARPYKSLRYLATDSWELGGTNWTDDFRKQFTRLRGYDPLPWLPVVAGRIVGDRDQSTRFLTDLRRTVADLIVTEHYDEFARRASQHGMGVQAESGGPHGAPIDALETFRHAAVPQSEFWSQNPHRNTDEERFFTKEAASAANIYGKHLVAQEGETSIGPQWSESLATDLKPSFDMAITEGMNRLVWHEFTSSPASTGLPGQEYFAGTHLNPKVTWWNAGGAFFTYLNRVQFLMQQGTPVDDVLYFYGDNVPNFVRLKADDPAHVLPGYDYDVTNEDALLHTVRVDGPDLVGPSGVRWRMLALPRTRRVSLAVLEFTERYLQGGGTVVGLASSSPTGLLAPGEQAQFGALSQRIWSGCAAGSSHAFGQGRVFCTDDSQSALRGLNIAPDVSLVDMNATPASAHLGASSSAGFDYVHRRIGSTDIYFLRNASAAPVNLAADLRAAGGQVELWDSVTGEMRAAPQSQTAGGRTRLPLHLDPFGSTFVVISPVGRRLQPVVTTASQPEPLELVQPWALTFQPGRGAPANATSVSELKSWTESSDAGIRYFSGTATYRAGVLAPRGHSRHVSLEFAGVHEIARVRINGKEAGTVWAAPYRLEVGALLHSGVNEVEIEVTNLWPNRIIGDLQPGNPQRITTTNITTYKVDSPLMPSGLIGVVQWKLDW
jgi:hypothetical protein